MASRLLYLVRHAAADPDPEDPVNGGTLNDLGMTQAAALGDRLAEVPFDGIYHSTALQAVETADILAFSLTLVPRHGDELLRECVPARPADDVLTQAQRDYFDRLPGVVLDGGAAQAQRAWENYSRVGSTDRRDLVISHGNLINYFVACALDAPAHGWLRPVDYHCGLTVIRFHDRFPPRVLCVNDTGHLASDLRGVEYPDDLRY
ncbi:MAG TPA: histidine phosphatase family protein [Candidatus Stackebrandtia excrementipullorum]|nr:histidine phosphatase family protein [Candidatus Stackebrandtia excrementipullorum]